MGNIPKAVVEGNLQSYIYIRERGKNLEVHDFSFIMLLEKKLKLPGICNREIIKNNKLENKIYNRKKLQNVDSLKD